MEQEKCMFCIYKRCNSMWKKWGENERERDWTPLNDRTRQLLVECAIDYIDSLTVVVVDRNVNYLT